MLFWLLGFDGRFYLKREEEIENWWLSNRDEEGGMVREKERESSESTSQCSLLLFF